MPRLLMIVRRSQIERFRLLRERFAGEEICVIWDRRQHERREDPLALLPYDRRRRDRRGALPISWTALDFVTVSMPDAGSAASASLADPRR